MRDWPIPKVYRYCLMVNIISTTVMKPLSSDTLSFLITKHVNHCSNNIPNNASRNIVYSSTKPISHDCYRKFNTPRSTAFKNTSRYLLKW